ncbi:MAG TPA: hypothetical protein VFS60_08095 [Thermoanaerobaculia bacterium]|nr:hypothetical protein [Thermoanaerobaculia bacterium]
MTAFLALPGAALAGEGFGMLNKDYASLQRTHPPKVFLRGTRIAVVAKGQQQELAGTAEQLRSLLESEVLSADPRLSAEPTRPETLIEVTVVESRGNERWETRTVRKMRERGKDAKGKPIIEWYEAQVQYKIVTYSLGVAYKVQDVRTKASLDADTVTRRYEEDFAEGTGAPEVATLQSTLIGQVVEAIKVRITPSREQIGALIPRGSLKDLSNLASASLWNQYLEALEAMPAKPKPADDAYRQYGMGLAYEALGYAAEGSTDDTLRYLQQAAVYYNQALQMNPGEKYFSQPYQMSAFNPAALVGRANAGGSYPAPLNRVKSALVDYQRIKEFAAGGPAAEGAQGGGGIPAGAKALGADTFDNADVIEMVKAGLPEDVILTAIADAENPSFDTSPKGLIELGKAKVSKKIMQRIQARAGQS